MNDGFTRISEVVPLLAHCEHHEPELMIKEKHASLILTYLDDNNVKLYSDKEGKLYWEKEGEDRVELSMDDVIDQVCDFNYSDMMDMKHRCMESSSYEEFCVLDDKYKMIKKAGKTLDKLFDRTRYGKDIAFKMKKMALKAVSEAKAIPIYDLPQLDDSRFMPQVREDAKPATVKQTHPVRMEKGQVI